MKIKSIKEIGGMVRQRRIEKKFTLPELAMLAKVSKGTLSKLENGKCQDIGIMTLQKIMVRIGGI